VRPPNSREHGAFSRVKSVIGAKKSYKPYIDTSSNHLYGAADYLSPVKLANPSNSPHIQKRPYDVDKIDGFNDGFTTEQQRYMNRLKRSQAKQDKVFSSHMSQVTVPQRVRMINTTAQEDISILE
jgi:hypothetical protein